jgi:hypothetical protein
MYHPFSVTETLSITWNILKKNFSTIAVYTLVTFAIVGGSTFVIYDLINDEVITSIGIILLLIGISFLFLGFIKLIFQLIDKEFYDFDFSDIVPRIKMLVSYLILLVIVSTLAVFMMNGIKYLGEGIVQSILGLGIFLFIQFFFLFYFPICACFIVDDQSGPFESVAQSFSLIKGNFIKYFLLFLIIEALVLVGTLTRIGMIFVIPFVNMLLVVAYRKLVYSHLDVDDEITETL